MSPELLVAIVASSFGLIGGVIGILAGAKQRGASTNEMESSAAKNIAEAYKILNNTLGERIRNLEIRIDELERKLEDCRGEKL